MQHLAVKARSSTTTDRGEFTALAATWAVDRVRDRIIQGAFATTIEAWQASGKMVPVHWAHSREAKDIIGVIDPASMRETAEGLYVAGRLDLENSEVAREAWRSMKANSVALSFGYLAVRERKRDNGINELLEIDLFEVTVASGPINPDTRFLSLKADAATVPSEAELRKASDRVRLSILMDGVPRHHPPEPTGPTEAELRREWGRHRIEMATEGIAAPDPPSVRDDSPTEHELRAKCAAAGIPHPPPRPQASSQDELRRQSRDLMLRILTHPSAPHGKG